MLFTLLAACSTPPPPAPEPVAEVEPEAAPAEVETPDRNREPFVKSARITPPNPTVTDDLVAEAEGEDPDGDLLAYTYTWYLNDRELLGRNSARLTAEFARGDVIRAVAHATDTHGNSADANASAVTILNATPVIDTDPRSIHRIDAYVMEGHDPDGDACIWKLEGAPEGMTIASDGRMKYPGSATEKGGHYDVKITCDDGHGAWGTVQLPLDVSPGSEAVKKAKEEEKKKAEAAGGGTAKVGDGKAPVR